MKQERLPRTARAPFIVSEARSGILIDELSRVENIERARSYIPLATNDRSCRLLKRSGLGPI